MLIDPSIELLLIEVADHDEHRVIRTIVSLVKLLGIFTSGGGKLIEISDHAAPVRVLLKSDVVEQPVKLAVRRGEYALTVLFFHDVPFGREICLVNVQVYHPIGFSPQNAFQMTRWNDLVVVRVIGPR